MRDGTADAPITVQAAPDAAVVLSGSGQLLQIEHAHWVFDGIVFDGGFGTESIVQITSSGNHTRLQGVEVRNSKRDCIEIDSPVGVTISDGEIHHCLFIDPDDGDRLDAHAITAAAVTNLTIEDTKIHTFSGDGIHLGQGRTPPGWNDVRIEGSEIWLTALTEDTAGFPAGSIPGENAIETQTWNDAPTADLAIIDSRFWGFQSGIDTTNQAALLIREHVNASISRTTISDSTIAFRLRGPTSARPRGPTVHIDNTLIHDVATAIQYEDDLAQLQLWHVTMGVDIAQLLVEIDSESTAPDVQNSLFWADELPDLVRAEDRNLTASSADFLNAPAGDHHLADDSHAIDAGQIITGMDFDRDGESRSEGEAPDVGAYEFTGSVLEDTGSGDTGSEDTEPPNDETDADEPNDTGAETDQADPPSGIGAAEQVGETGGCGCTAAPSPHRWTSWMMLLGIAILRRVPKRSSSDFFT